MQPDREAVQDEAQLGLLQAKQVRKLLAAQPPVTEVQLEEVEEDEGNTTWTSLMHAQYLRFSGAGTGKHALVPATGANASLNEEGYKIVALQCCNWEMAEFIGRVVDNLGYKVCTAGDVHGLAPFYSCEKGPKTLAELQAEIIAASTSDCPWVALAGEECTPKAADCPTFPEATVSYDCGCSRGDSFNIDFFGSTLKHSNLNGLGPDSGAQELRYENIGTFNGGVLDLVVTTSSSYGSSATNTNGKNGKFGTINLRGGVTADMTFTLVATGTSTPVELGELFFSMHDLDESFSRKMIESVYASDFNGYVVDKGIEFLVEHDSADGRTRFTSNHHGLACDNPTDPETLGPITCTYRDGEKTVDQRKRTFMLVFKKVSSFTLTFDVSCLGVHGDTTCESGRNFLFSGSSSLKDRCAD
jgi:hypothetical protein